MIGTRYKAHKSNVIDLFNRYKSKRGGLNDGVDLKFLESRVMALEEGKFTLAVAGEVKAGKSTFINALLGAEILPSDVLQATSAIVQIFKSNTPFLKVKFAGGNEELIYDDAETTERHRAVERLHKICKLDDRYRPIPVMLIDRYILDSDGDLAVDEEFIKKLGHPSGDDLSDKQDLIQQYISERPKDRIPVEIEFGYPLKWEFDELRIVDSPGVNAMGGVQDVSYRFLEEANAILFVHPIKPVESQSFRKFVTSVISNRSKETLFLILTHTGHHTDNDVERLHAEARRLYKDMIPEDRILAVDSLLKLIHCDLENGVSVEDIMKSDMKAILLPRYQYQAKDKGGELIDVVLEGSRFKNMITAIDKFSMNAPNLQLREIIEQIKRGYEDQETQYVEKAERLEKKKRNPQEYEEAIDLIIKALGGYRLYINNTTEDLKTKYRGRDSRWQKSLDDLKDRYNKCLNESESKEDIRKNTQDGWNDVQENFRNLSAELRQTLGDALEKSGKQFKANEGILVPRIDLHALEAEARITKKVPKYEIYYTRHWYTLWLIEKKHEKQAGWKIVEDEAKSLKAFKRHCIGVLNDTIHKVQATSKDLVDNYLRLFHKEMDAAIGARQEALRQEREAKDTNDELIDEIKKLGRKKKTIQPEKKRCVEVLGDIV